MVFNVRLLVFLAEYAGPLLVYLWIYQRPWIFYGDVSASTISPTAQWVRLWPCVFKHTLSIILNFFSIAAACYTIHYAKRLLETIFVHRFSHATMPLSNLFKNCSYYWGFTAYVAYHVNHPLYTSPAMPIVYGGLAGLLVNFSVTNFFFFSYQILNYCSWANSETSRFTSTSAIFVLQARQSARSQFQIRIHWPLSSTLSPVPTTLTNSAHGCHFL